jgi:hypothetical protein
MLNSSGASALNTALGELFGAVNRHTLQEHLADRFDAQQIEDLAAFITGGSASVVHQWVTAGDEPLDRSTSLTG